MPYGKKRLLAVGGLAFFIDAALVGQAIPRSLRAQGEEVLKFDVASIRPIESPAGVLILSPEGRQIEAHGNRISVCRSLREFLMDAYGVKDYQISGLPNWGEQHVGDGYVIDAVAPGVPTEKQWRSMLQNLLAERFQLKLRRDKKDLPVYALVVDKKGFKLRRASEGAESQSIQELIFTLAMHLDRPVLDHTGLEGRFDASGIDWDLGAVLRGDTAAAPDSAIFAVVEERFGLRLEPRKELTDVLMIEQVSKPSVN